MDKKAVSEVIAWVLLFGLAIILATLVGNWAIRMARQFQPETTMAPELYCDNVAIIIDLSSCPTATIKNKGSYTVSSTLLRITDSAGITTNSEGPGNILPGSSATVSCPGGNLEMEIIPKITRDNKDIVCDKKTYRLDTAMINTCCP